MKQTCYYQHQHTDQLTCMRNVKNMNDKHIGVLVLLLKLKKNHEFLIKNDLVVITAQGWFKESNLEFVGFYAKFHLLVLDQIVSCSY